MTRKLTGKDLADALTEAGISGLIGQDYGWLHVEGTDYSDVCIDDWFDLEKAAAKLNEIVEDGT